MVGGAAGFAGLNGVAAQSSTPEVTPSAFPMASPGLRGALNQVIDRAGHAETIFGGFIDVEWAGFMTQTRAIDPTVRNPNRNLIRRPQPALRQRLGRLGW